METKLPWWKRFQKGVQTSTKEKKETPEGIWHLCERCKSTMLTAKLVENMYVCPECNYHERIDASVYFDILFGKGNYTEHFADLMPVDALGFEDSKPYKQRIADTIATTGLSEAMRVVSGTCGAHELVVAGMDFRFIGGSMGAVVGEKISRAIDYCLQ
jgi:Acetyl-CoA carboxylase beta subunit